VELAGPLDAVPPSLVDHGVTLSEDGCHLVYTFDSTAERTGMTRLMADIAEAGLHVRDLSTRQSSLEEVFLRLVDEGAGAMEAAQ